MAALGATRALCCGWWHTAASRRRSPTQADQRETQPGGAQIPVVMVTIAVALAMLPAGLWLLGGAPSA